MSQLLGEIRRFTGGTLPVGWIACDGTVLRIASHQPLFSLLGWRFGGDGWTTFRVPTLPSMHPVLRYGISTNGLYPTRYGPMPQDAYVGEIRLYGGDQPPAGWLPCDGREIPIADHLALYEAIGTAWGGRDGHFALPDLRGSESDGAPIGRLTYIIAAAGRRTEEA
jgi:microcystin-dependent protein